MKARRASEGCNANTRTWLEAFGMSANNDEVTARTLKSKYVQPADPKCPASVSRLPMGSRAIRWSTCAATPTDFRVCARHASRKTILAIKINAVFERWGLKATVMAGHPTDPTIFRKASGHIARTALSHTRSRRPGFFYLFERTDVNPPVLKFGVDFCEHDDDVEGLITGRRRHAAQRSTTARYLGILPTPGCSTGFFYFFERTDVNPPVLKFGVDFCEYDDDVEGPIVGHETSSCRPEIDHHAVSGHFADAGLFDHVVNMLLDPVKEQIVCPCARNHREYFALGQYAVQTL
ncbi:hypothetical protein BDZ88DRAFT_439514 [Geranomyces variabilis]|nr:hypothetical protein BDZ88DRAFT_439514 [Geranomyces variabilis]KAJ3135128.1 hypothetical protein HDU90_004160 [Geranomyces variabilis]